MTHTVHPILTDIEAFLAETGMGETYFGRRAARNTELVARLREGGDIQTKTEASIRAFMDAKRAESRAGAA